jgi:hypothetical protein
MLIEIEQLVTPKEGNPMLSSLREIPTPADINWWPQTLGWQLLLLLAFCYLLYRVYGVFQKYISNAYRRAALAELMLIDIDEGSAELSQLSQPQLSEPSELSKIPHIIRKTALYAYDRKQVAPLIGKEWEHWLDQQCEHVSFSSNYSGLLAHLTYSDQIQISREQLLGLKSQVATWIKNHRGNHD